MKILGYEFHEMTNDDWMGYAGAEQGTLICHVEDGDVGFDLLWDPANKTLSEIYTDADRKNGFNQRDWTFVDMEMF